MWVIETGPDYSDSYEEEFNFHESMVAWFQIKTDEFLQRRLIDLEEAQNAMSWVEGVVIDDIGVRVPATFGGYTVVITRTE